MRFWICILLVAASAQAAAADPGTRPYMVDATVGFRTGDTSGWNARLFLGGVPWGNLSPARTDRSVYIGLGAQAGIGGIHIAEMDGTGRWRGTWTAGPELRTGVAWGGREHLDAHAYVAVSPMVMHVDEDAALQDRGYHAGVRLAMGLSSPKLRRETLHLGPLFEHEHVDYGSASGGMEDEQLMFDALGAVFVFFFPDTVEVTYERASGVERVGLAVGYSL